MATNLGLSVNDVVNIQVSLSPVAAQQRNFSSLLILGDSGVIDVQSRYRLYTSLSGVAADFGTTAPEYYGAQIFFAQNPQPAQLYIGAWARNATPGTLIGGVLSAAQQALTNFTTITNGSLTITVNGTQHNLTGVNLSGATSLSGVAALITIALGGIATVTWNAVYNYFQFTSPTTGTSSTVGFLTLEGSGTDMSAPLGGQSTQGGYVANGIAAETPLSCVTTLAGMTNNWYGVMFAAATPPQDSDYVAVAGLIQGLTVSHIFGVTSQEAAALVANNSTDIGSQLQALGYSRSFVHYSSSSPYACAGEFGIAFTVNFSGNATTITLKFKIVIGVVAETLTESQAAALIAKNINVYVNYNNNTAILQNGTMANGQFFDTVHGTDALQNALQTAVYNVLITIPTKVPDTDAGVGQLVAAMAGICDQFVTNGLLAGGKWLGPNIGILQTNQTITGGYYIYAPPVSTQSAAARAARQSPLIQIAAKLAGAIHSVGVVVNVSN